MERSIVELTEIFKQELCFFFFLKVSRDIFFLHWYVGDLSYFCSFEIKSNLRS